MSIVLVGDGSVAEGLPLLEAAFGGVGRAAPAGALAPPEALRERHVFVDAPGANQARITVVWPAPARADPDAAAYALAFRALAGGFASRLNLRLREAEGLTYRVDGATWAERAFGRSEVELSVDPERLRAALVTLAKELDAARGGFTEAEVEASRRQLWADVSSDTSTLAGVARGLWTDLQEGLGPGDTWRVAPDVSLAEVDAAAARWLAEPRLWLVSGDGDTLEPALDEAGWAVDTRWGACFAVYGGRCP